MFLRRFVIVLLLVAAPAALHARWIKDKVEMPNDGGMVTFSHYNHLEAVGNNCPTCHNEVFHVLPSKNPPFTMAQMEEGKSCGVCHNGKRAFTVAENCDTCHQM